jgi:hypothetical protein
VHVYPVSPDAASSIADGGVVVAVRLANLVTPLRNGRLPGGGCRPALVIGGTRRIRTGEPVVFCKIVAVAPAQVRRDGRVQAKGSPVHHARLGRWRSGWRRSPGRASSTGSRNVPCCGPGS